MATEAFLSGLIALASSAASLFFLRFWRDTRDSFFLAFSISFLIETAYRIVVLLSSDSKEGSISVYVLHLIGYVVILAAIVRKNFGRAR